MFWILANCPFSYFQIKVFNISRVIEGVKPQFVNLNINFFKKKKRKEKKRKEQSKRKEYFNSLMFLFFFKYSFKI